MFCDPTAVELLQDFFVTDGSICGIVPNLLTKLAEEPFVGIGLFFLLSFFFYLKRAHALQFVTPRVFKYSFILYMHESFSVPCLSMNQTTILLELQISFVRHAIGSTFVVFYTFWNWKESAKMGLI